MRQREAVSPLVEIVAGAPGGSDDAPVIHQRLTLWQAVFRMSLRAAPGSARTPTG
jgi:hypothetical protein